MNKKIISILFATILISNLNAKRQQSRFWSDCQDWSQKSSELMENFFENLKETRKNIDNIFNNFVESFEEGTSLKEMNIFETKSGDEWGIEFKIPGYKKEDISIKIDNNGYLHIKAENKKTAEIEKTKDKKYIYKSKSFSSKQFSKTIKLPENIEYKDSKNIKLNYDEKTGILEIKFTKKEYIKEEPKEIELKLK
jgi:HSP20 family protein